MDDSLSKAKEQTPRSIPAERDPLTYGKRDNPPSIPARWDIEDTLGENVQNTSLEKKRILIVKDLLKVSPERYKSHKEFRELMIEISRKYKANPSKWSLGDTYRKLHAEKPEDYPFLYELNKALMQKAVRGDSGILNISVSLPPDTFSCKYNCHFCPNEPGMPRSYLSNEDVFKRASQVNFNTAEQVWIRLKALEANGHAIDKLEFRVLGGTFSSYEHEVTDTFIRDLYFAANTYYSDRERERGSIEEEQNENVGARVHVVGLGVETRPDSITIPEIKRFRKYGVTRVEIGVQHTDDNLLRKVNRGHLVKHSKEAVKLLKEYGFKVEIHIMADLPGATPEGDKECYREVLQGEDLIPDYLKDYPCLDVDFTKIKEWKETGKWKPYAESTPDARDLKDVLIYRQAITPKWVRVNRVQRDFQEAKDGRIGYRSEGIRTNMSQIVKKEAEDKGIYCQCIRCCELRDQKFEEKDIVYTEAKFVASGATEYFISAEIVQKGKPRNILLGFIRLRLSEGLLSAEIEELRGKTAMIRELHVYGKITAVGEESKGSAQHKGIGKELLERAERIAKANTYEQMAIISGIGVRGYYAKRGYELRGSYMMKDLRKVEVRYYNYNYKYLNYIALLIVCIAILRNYIEW